MIFHLLTWPLIAASLFLWGLVLLRIGGVTRPGEASGDPGDVVFAALWAGLAAPACLLPLAALAMPLTPAVGTAVLLLPWLSLADPRLRKIVATLLRAAIAGSTRRLALMQMAALGVVAWIGSAQVVYFDTAFYHLQLARLFEEHGAVRGIVALYLNFGQTSSWFAIGAPATAGGEFGWGTSIPNTYVAGLAAVHAVACLERLGRGVHRPADLIAGLGLFLVLVMAARWHMVASLSPDLPVMLFGVVVAWALALDRRDLGIVTGLLGTGVALGIKLSALPLGLVALVLAVSAYRGHRRCVVGGTLLAAATLAPTLVLAVLASGCLAFPAAATCLPLPWTPEAAAVDRHYARIVDGARSGGLDLPAGTRLADRLAVWLWRDVSGVVTVLGGLALSAGLSAVAAFFRGRVPLWPLAIGTCGVLYITLTAPTGRFIGGYAGVLAALVPVAAPGVATGIAWLVRPGLLLPLLLVAVVALHHSGPGASVRDLVAERAATGLYPDPGNGILLPRRIVPFDVHDPALPRLNTWKMTSNGFVAVRSPIANGECWAAPPPCVPQGPSAGVRYLDPAKGIARGFRIDRGG